MNKPAEKDEHLVPKENLIIYGILYNIEVGLREFIIEILENKFGPRWWKTRLSADLIYSFKEGMKSVEKTRWWEVVIHHPVYYLNFPDLKKIIEQKDNWRNVFENVFGRKDLIIGKLVELEFIRNDIAHNRRGSQKQVASAKAALEGLKSCLGEEKFQQYIGSMPSAEDIPQKLTYLEQDSGKNFRVVMKYQEISNLVIWEGVNSKWWFDSSYLGKDISQIKCLYEKYMVYRELPRFRGLGHEIEHWVKTQKIEEIYKKASKEFAILLGESSD